MINNRVLIVEDEELMRSILRQLIGRAGYEVFTADSAESAIDLFRNGDIAVTLTDIKMSGRDGLALLDQIKSADDEAIVIIMTAYSSVDTAVAALRKGAYDYITKPFVNEDLLQTIKNAVSHRHLFNENRVLRRELRKQHDFSGIVGKADEMQKVFELVRKVAGTSANVLIQGESGTGKELIARSIHYNSGRQEKPFLAVNCAALPELLLESELFGHLKGSFTGATADQKGLFRSAEGGTLLLDEIGDMPQALQVKLLRTLQEHEVTPVGASLPIPVDVRIIAATNKDLEKEVAEGRFREDLYYRLNVVEIDAPPLRSRREDIPLLIKYFISKSARAMGVGEKPLTGQALTTLAAYEWPGNVRELEHVIERAMILSGDEIDVESLPAKVRRDREGGDASSRTQPTLEEIERRYVCEVLESVADDKVEAARILGIDLSTLYRKIKKYEVDRRRITSPIVRE